MPGKINPVIPEVVTQVAFHVIGNDTTITMAAEAGQMELNAFEPVVFYSLFSSITSMTGAVNTLVKNCILGITANEKRCEDLVSKSVGITTALCPYIGYQKAASIAKKSLKTGESVTSLVLKDELLTQKQLDDILESISEKISYLCESNIAAIERQMNEVVSAFTELQKKTEAMFANITPDDISKLTSAMADGQFSEERLVKAYTNQMKGDADESVEQTERMD